jgi:hypothetical protein
LDRNLIFYSHSNKAVPGIADSRCSRIGDHKEVFAREQDLGKLLDPFALISLEVRDHLSGVPDPEITRKAG